ncbi:MAG: glycine cleavage system protein GcvH [Deltaproteobacteria bacterium]|jgi:glycine cleavage system H protein|nr:glycine cleavage system protein GcvH [Deltaproteobacteria bacterium]
MSIPEGLKYAKTHEWVLIEGDTATIGITAFAQEQLGDITFVELPPAGTSLGSGDEFGSVESVKAASELYSPVSGEVIAVNADLEESPGLINSDPYHGGWMIKVKFSGLSPELLSSADYSKLLEA